jgi:hypothetical protein
LKEASSAVFRPGNSSGSSGAWYSS